VYPRRWVSQLLRLVVLVTLAVLMLSACGGSKRKPRFATYRSKRKPYNPANTAPRSLSPRFPSGSIRAGKTTHLRPSTSCCSGKRQAGWAQ
jgi:hypothetical protein